MVFSYRVAPMTAYGCKCTTARRTCGSTESSWRPRMASIESSTMASKMTAASWHTPGGSDFARWWNLTLPHLPRICIAVNGASRLCRTFSQKGCHFVILSSTNWRQAEVSPTGEPRTLVHPRSSWKPAPTSRAISSSVQRSTRARHFFIFSESPMSSSSFSSSILNLMIVSTVSTSVISSRYSHKACRTSGRVRCAAAMAASVNTSENRSEAGMSP